MKMDEECASIKKEIETGNGRLKDNIDIKLDKISKLKGERDIVKGDEANHNEKIVKLGKELKKKQTIMQ